MVDLELKMYLKAEDFDGELDIEFLDEGEYVEIKQKDGTMKRVFNILVALPSGEERTWSPNATSQQIIARKFSNKTKTWVHKRWVLEKVKMNVAGQMKHVILAKENP